MDTDYPFDWALSWQQAIEEATLQSNWKKLNSFTHTRYSSANFILLESIETLENIDPNITNLESNLTFIVEIPTADFWLIRLNEKSSSNTLKWFRTIFPRALSSVNTFLEGRCVTHKTKWKKFPIKNVLCECLDIRMSQSYSSTKTNLNLIKRKKNTLFVCF